MNIDAMNWAMFLVGSIIGALAGGAVMSLCAMSSYNSQGARIDELRVALGDLDALRVALGDLVRAVESERLSNCFVEVPDTPVYEALERAREVLER
jgi:hypothetical protein